MDDTRKTWIIFGATGQLGIDFATKLQKFNVDVVKPESKEIDITNHESVNKLFLEVCPDVVLNAAAWTDVDRAEKNSDRVFNVNAIGPKNLAIASKNSNTALIQISTDYIFSGNRSDPWEIGSPAFPSTVYGKSKLIGEEYIREIYQEGSYIFRTSWLFSEHRKNFVKTMVRKALYDTGEIRVISDQRGAPTSTSDLAERIMISVQKELPKGTYHFSNSGEASWFEFASVIFELCGADSSRVKAIESIEYESSTPRPRYSLLSNDCWNEFDFMPSRHWRKALEEKIPAVIQNVMREKNAS